MSRCVVALGNNRDGKMGKLQVNYGLLTDGGGLIAQKATETLRQGRRVAFARCLA